MSEVREKAARLKRAASVAASLSTEVKNRALNALAHELRESEEALLSANAIDVEAARAAGHTESTVDRLLLNGARISGLAEGVTALCGLPDPLGEIMGQWTLSTGLRIEKVRCPFGVIGIIYEGRPNVTIDAAALCFKAGNCVLLRGSSSALNSNIALVKVLRRALSTCGIDAGIVELIEDGSRDSATEMLGLTGYLDVLIPRGGAALIQHVVREARVPVIETGAGNCHIYIHADADPEMALQIAVNAKTQRPAVCNAMETLLVERSWAAKHLIDIIRALEDKGVECRGCPESKVLVPDLKAAQESDWETEFLDLVLAVKIVDDISGAIAHINRYGTRHSEAIITVSDEAARKFMREVDAAAVYHNASTRFTDGFEFGFGAEIGISTQKLHARGPMGLPELTSYKYMLYGTGQVRA